MYFIGWFYFLSETFYLHSIFYLSKYCFCIFSLTSQLFLMNWEKEAFGDSGVRVRGLRLGQRNNESTFTFIIKLLGDRVRFQVATFSSVTAKVIAEKDRRKFVILNIIFFF